MQGQRQGDLRNRDESSQEEALPLQTLQHLPSGRICSLTVQLSSGQVSTTFTIRPFWKERINAGNDEAEQVANSIKMPVESGESAPSFSLDIENLLLLCTLVVSCFLNLHQSFFSSLSEFPVFLQFLANPHVLQASP